MIYAFDCCFCSYDVARWKSALLEWLHVVLRADGRACQDPSVSLKVQNTDPKSGAGGRVSLDLTMTTLKPFHCVYYLYRNQSVCLYVFLSVCILFCFDIGLPYLAHRCITKRGCVAYIHDPNTTLTFDLKVKIGFLTWLCVRVTAFLWHSHTIYVTWVYHHGTMCHIHSWPLYDLNLWSQYQNYYFIMNLCMGKIVFTFWHRHTKIGICLYHHETTSCVLLWALYVLDLWHICRWREYMYS